MQSLHFALGFSNVGFDMYPFMTKNQGGSFDTPNNSIIKLHEKSKKEGHKKGERERKKMPKPTKMLKIIVHVFFLSIDPNEVFLEFDRIGSFQASSILMQTSKQLRKRLILHNTSEFCPTPLGILVFEGSCLNSHCESCGGLWFAFRNRIQGSKERI